MKLKTLTIIALFISAMLIGCGGNDEQAPTDPKELLAFLEAKIKQNPNKGNRAGKKEFGKLYRKAWWSRWQLNGAITEEH